MSVFFQRKVLSYFNYIYFPSNLLIVCICERSRKGRGCFVSLNAYV